MRDPSCATHAVNPAPPVHWQMRLRCSRLLTSLAVVAAPWTASAEATTNSTIKFDLPSDVAATSLKTFSRQSGLEVLISADLGKGTRTRAVHGEFTPREAIDLMLSHTVLVANQDEKSGAMIIHRAPDAPARLGGDNTSLPKKTETMTPRNPPPKSSAWLAALLSVAAATAQQPASTTATAPAPGELVELTPFTVSAGEDRGYQAQSSLSGSRLKTNLKDMAAPVSVFTDQFLRDTAITDTDELAKFMLSAEYDYGEDAGGQNRLFSQSRPLRFRGLTGGEVTTNFFPNEGNSDTFSTERVEQARGPNAILFGVGNPGGSINTTSKRAKLNANSGEIAAQFRSYNGLRIEGDYNLVLVPNRLAVRIAAVRTELNSWRNYQYNDSKRYFGTLKWRLTPRTELNAEIERGEISRHASRTFTALDGYTTWAAAGKNLSATANATLGIERTAAANATWLVFNENDHTLMNRSASTRTTARVQTGGLFDSILTDFSVLPRETSIIGPGTGQTRDYTRLSAFFSHAFTPNLNLEIAARRLDLDDLNVDPQVNVSQFLRADPSPTLPTGAPNPYAGQAYLESQQQRNYRRNRYDSVRAIGSYRFDLGRIFGAHTVAAMADYNYDYVDILQLREFVVSPNAPSLAGPENANNRVWRRTYVNLNGPSENIVMADWRLSSSSNLTDPVSGRVYQTDWLPFAANTVQYNANRTNNYIGMLQSEFWSKRINTVIGMSREDRTSYVSTAGRAPLAGFTNGPFYTIRAQDGIDASATNISFSAVFHARPWLALTYSRAKNSGLPVNNGSIPSPDGSLNNQQAPRAEGNSQDMGIKLDLFDRKLFLTAQYFQTSADNDFDFTLPVTQASLNAIWDALAANGVPDPLTNAPIAGTRDIVNGATFSSRTQGYEVELTANPTKNWRLFLNYNRTRTERTKIAPEMVNYVAFNRAYWTTGDRERMYLVGRGVGLAPVARDGNSTIDTIGEQLDAIDNSLLNNVTFANGRRPLGQIPQRLNFRTTYDFSSDRLKGFSVGAGVRWNDRPVVGFIAATATTDSVVVYGDAQTFIDANLSYRRQFKARGHRVNWSIALNVDNVLNNDKFVVLRQNNVGAILNYRFNEPRSWVITNRFAF